MSTNSSNLSTYSLGNQPDSATTPFSDPASVPEGTHGSATPPGEEIVKLPCGCLSMAFVLVVLTLLSYWFINNVNSLADTTINKLNVNTSIVAVALVLMGSAFGVYFRRERFHAMLRDIRALLAHGRRAAIIAWAGLTRLGGALWVGLLWLGGVLWLHKIFTLLLVIVVLLGSILYQLAALNSRPSSSLPSSATRPQAPLCLPIPCTVHEPDGQMIGISEGKDSFLSDNSPSNPEKLIYGENTYVASLKDNYITFVVLTVLSNSPDMAAQGQSEIGIGRDDLQGAYVLQKEDNGRGGCPLLSCLKMRLLIANFGFDAHYALPVARQIISLARQDPSIKGVIGLPVSTDDALQAIKELGDNNITMISSSASSDKLTGISPNFFRVSPIDKEQGRLAAQFISSTPPFSTTQKGALFFATDVPYSQTLSDAFRSSSGKVIIPETYQRLTDKQHRDQAIRSALQDAVNKGADFIYFASYSDDLNSLLNDLHSPQFQNIHLPVMAGDAAYDLSGYSGKGYQDLYFTSFSSPDEWGNTFSDPCAPQIFQSFFCDYASDFNPDKKQPPGIYGSTRVDSSIMLSYDALRLLINACMNTDKTKIADISAENVRQALLNNPNFSGVTGLITFGSDGNPIDKPMVIIYVAPDGHTVLLHTCRQSNSSWSC